MCRQRIDGTTNRALVYAAESRRLLSTAQALEAASGRSFPPWVPPSNKPYFSCALNVITTELSPADAAVADQFVYYARQANGGDASKGDNKTEICEYECQRIIAAQVPDLADRYSDMENKRKVRGLNIGRSANLRRLVVGLAALAAIAREIGMRWMLFAVSYLTILAWVISTAYYQLATFAVNPSASAGWLALCIGILVSFYVGLRLAGNKGGDNV